jgi:hypothetical protein
MYLYYINLLMSKCYLINSLKKWVVIYYLKCNLRNYIIMLHNVLVIETHPIIDWDKRFKKTFDVVWTHGPESIHQHFLTFWFIFCCIDNTETSWWWRFDLMNFITIITHYLFWLLLTITLSTSSLTSSVSSTSIAFFTTFFNCFGFLCL